MMTSVDATGYMTTWLMQHPSIAVPNLFWSERKCKLSVQSYFYAASSFERLGKLHSCDGKRESKSVKSWHRKLNVTKSLMVGLGAVSSFSLSPCTKVSDIYFFLNTYLADNFLVSKFGKHISVFLGKLWQNIIVSLSRFLFAFFWQKKELLIGNLTHHQASGPIVEHMTVLKAVVCLISARGMLEVLTHHSAHSCSGGCRVNYLCNVVGT